VSQSPYPVQRFGTWDLVLLVKAIFEFIRAAFSSWEMPLSLS
jgi:hypothetical protein